MDPQCNGTYKIWHDMGGTSASRLDSCKLCKSVVPHHMYFPLFSGKFSISLHRDDLSRRALLLLRQKRGSGNTILQEAKKRHISVRVGFGCKNNERYLKVTVEELVCVRRSLESVGLHLLKEEMTKTRGK